MFIDYKTIIILISSLIIQDTFEYDYKGIAKGEDNKKIFIHCNNCPRKSGLRKKTKVNIKIKSHESVVNYEDPLSYEFPSIYFGLGKIKFSHKENEKLKKIVNKLKDLNTNYYIEVVGFTSKSGSKNQNKYIANKRSESVSVGMKSLGIDNKQIKSIGKGSCCYVSKKSKNNQRVEIVVKKFNGGS